MGKKQKKKIIVVVSGGYDPIHIGHIRLLREAKKKGDKLVVILNSNEWLKGRKGAIFMNARERKDILLELRCVDSVFIHQSTGKDVSSALEKIKPSVFCNGGNIKSRNDLPQREIEICDKYNIELLFSVGGTKKVRSSYSMLRDYCQTLYCNEDTIVEKLKKKF